MHQLKLYPLAVDQAISNKIHCPKLNNTKNEKQKPLTLVNIFFYIRILDKFV